MNPRQKSGVVPKNTHHDYTFEKIPGSENSTLETVWSGYDNPENLEKTEIEKQMKEAHASLLSESAKWEAEQRTARWKDVFAYITEIVSDHITKENDPQFGPYDTPPCMRFLRWWD